MNDIETWKSLTDESAALQALAARELSSDIEDKLFTYCRLLQEFDAHTNLVANSSYPVLLKEHVLDSLQLLPWIQANPKPTPRLIDIGSGAGLPGMVLAIARPSMKVTLVESIGKKCRFLENTIAALEMSDRVTVVCERAETIAHFRKFRELYDFATARAVGALPVVAELCIPFLQVGGSLLAQRSKRQATEEQAETDAYASKLGGELLETIHFDPDLLGRELSMLRIEKVKHTMRWYPRSASQMKREDIRK